MNPITIRKPQDRQKIYNEYIASLAAQTQLLDRTAQAVSVLKQTGQAPQQPTDMRTITQKALDFDGQKITVRKLLYSITDGQQISNIMDELSDGEITFLSWAYQDIFNQLKAKYAAGVPGPIFIEYLRRYMADYSKNLGVKSGLQNAKSDELMLSMREIIDLLPNQQTIDELIHTIRSIPADLANTQLKQEALQAVIDLKAAVPGTVLVEKSAALDPVDLTKATTLMNNGFENAPSSQQTMKMANTVNRAISSHSQGQVDDVLTSLLNTFRMERDDFIKIEQGKATILNEKAAFDTILPERASSIESKALQNAPRKIRSDRIPSAEQFQDFAYIESPEIDLEQIDEKFSATELRKWAALKINSGEIFIKGGASKMSKNEILELVNDYKTHGLEFSKETIDNFAPEAKELQKESATKVQLAFREKKQREADEKVVQKRILEEKAAEKKIADATKIQALFRGRVDIKKSKQLKAIQSKFDPDMSENEYKVLPFEDKYSILRDMIQQQIPETLLNKDDLETFTSMIGKHEKDDEQHYIEFFDFMINKLKPVGGHGFSNKKAGKKIAFGCGLKPSMKVKASNIDFDSGIKRETTYIPLGRYFVNRHKLGDNKLMIKTIKGGAVHGLPTLTISPKLSKMIHKIVTGKGFPSHNELGDLDDDDKDILHKIFKLSQAEGIESIPAPSKSRDEQELNRFTILKGEIVAGNNSKELVKEFKVLLLKMMNEGKIGKAAGREILMDLVSLGY